MVAFMDFTCDACGRRFGDYSSEDLEFVVCPNCGRRHDLGEIHRELERMRQAILDDESE